MGKGAAKAAQNISTDVANKALTTSGTVGSMSIPWLQQAGKYYSDVASGDPGAVSSAVAPQLNASRDAYAQASNQISQTTTKGGSRDAAMTQLGISQAGDTSRIVTGGIQQAISNLANLGTGGTQISLSGLGIGDQSAANLGQLAGMKAQAFGAGIGGLGQGVGTYLGMRALKP